MKLSSASLLAQLKNHTEVQKNVLVSLFLFLCKIIERLHDV